MIGRQISNSGRTPTWAPDIEQRLGGSLAIVRDRVHPRLDARGPRCTVCPWKIATEPMLICSAAQVRHPVPVVRGGMCRREC